MHMPFLESIDKQPNAAIVRTNYKSCDCSLGVIDFGTAIVGLVDVGVGLQFVRRDICGRLGVDFMSECQFKASWLRSSRMEFLRAELTTDLSKASLGIRDYLVPPLFLRVHDPFNVEVLHSAQQKRETVDPLLHDLHELVVSRSAKRRIGVTDVPTGRCCPTVYTPYPTVSLHGADGTWIEFVVDQMAAVAV